MTGCVVKSEIWWIVKVVLLAREENQSWFHVVDYVLRLFVGGILEFLSCTVYYRYDEKFISFNRIDSFSSPTDIKNSMYIPDSLDYTNLPKNIIAKARIFGAFDDYNGQILPFPDIYQNIQFEKFTGATRTYNEVIKFKSNNPNSYYHDGWNRYYNINEVWYDRKYGFVYFKDIYGQEWSRQN